MTKEELNRAQVQPLGQPRTGGFVSQVVPVPVFTRSPRRLRAASTRPSTRFLNPLARTRRTCCRDRRSVADLDARRADGWIRRAGVVASATGGGPGVTRARAAAHPAARARAALRRPVRTGTVRQRRAAISTASGCAVLSRSAPPPARDASAAGPGSSSRFSIRA